MLQRQYQSHELSELIYRAKTNVRTRYKNANPEWLDLIAILETSHEFINKLRVKANFAKDLREICLGAWLFCLESIGKDYVWTGPEYKEGFFFNSGSTLYTILLDELGITKTHFITEKEKLAYLSAYYHFIYHTFDVYVEEKTLHDLFIRKPYLKSNLQYILQRVLARESKNQNRLLKAIPAESVIDLKMGKLYVDYLEKAKTNNPARQFAAKLAVSICNLNMKDNEQYSNFMPPSLRIKLGAIFYLIMSIRAEGWFEPSSELYHLALEILCGSYHHINEATKIECLLEFKYFVLDYNNKIKIENYFNDFLTDQKEHIYINKRMNDQVYTKIDHLLASLNDTPVQVSAVTKSVMVLAAIVGGLAGHPIGFGIGFSIEKTDPADAIKNQLSDVTRAVMKIIFHEAGSYLGWYAADTIVNAALEHTFAVIFEALAGTLAAAGCGMMSLIIYDYSFVTARQLCKFYYELNDGLSKELGANFIKEDDEKFINTLLSLPDEIFSEVQKEKLKTVIGKTSELGLLARTRGPALDNDKKFQPICLPMR